MTVRQGAMSRWCNGAMTMTGVGRCLSIFNSPIGRHHSNHQVSLVGLPLGLELSTCHSFLTDLQEFFQKYSHFFDNTFELGMILAPPTMTNSRLLDEKAPRGTCTLYRHGTNRELAKKYTCVVNQVRKSAWASIWT